MKDQVEAQVDAIQETMSKHSGMTTLIMLLQLYVTTQFPLPLLINGTKPSAIARGFDGEAS